MTTKPWPFFGYAPGEYESTCPTCSKRHVADKRASNCLECAVIAAKDMIASHREQVATPKVNERHFTPKSNPDILHREELLALAADIRKGNEDTSGVYFANEEYNVIFRPGGGNYTKGDRTVAKCACGGLASIMPSLIARALNIVVLIANGLPDEKAKPTPVYRDGSLQQVTAKRSPKEVVQ